MTDNPYAAPVAVVQDTHISSSAVRLYSPVQVACGTIGGPIGLIYFLKANFRALGNYKAERKTLIFGTALLAALIVTLPILPDDFPNLPFTIGYALIALHVAGKYQKTKKAIIASPLLEFHSNWRVLGIGLLCLLASLIAIIVPLAVFYFLGIWNPESGA